MAERVTLGERVALLRKVRRLTQVALAARVGVSPQTISNWENDVSQVPSAEVPTVANALGVSVAELYGEGQGPATEPRNGGQGSRHKQPPHAGDGGRIEDLFNVPPSEVPRPAGVKPLPIYRWGSMGDPRDRDSSPHPDREEYPPAGREHLIGPNGFGVDVRGTSMVGRDLHDGDICWVNPDRPYRLGDLVLAEVIDANGESGMVVKTYARTEVGECLLSEDGVGKTPVVCRQFKIIGPVVGVQRWFPPR